MIIIKELLSLLESKLPSTDAVIKMLRQINTDVNSDKNSDESIVELTDWEANADIIANMYEDGVTKEAAMKIAKAVAVKARAEKISKFNEGLNEEYEAPEFEMSFTDKGNEKKAVAALKAAGIKYKVKELEMGLGNNYIFKDRETLKKAVQSVAAVIDETKEDDGMWHTLGLSADVPKEPKEKEVSAFIKLCQDNLSYEARYKQFDIDMETKTVELVTQQTTPAGSKTAATALAKLFKQHGWSGWTIKVIVRDLYNGDNKDSLPWKRATS